MTSSEASSDVRLSEVIAPSFHQLHKAIKSDKPSEVWCKGGRGSTKSSFIAEEIFLLLSQDANAHAFISRRYDNELRDSVFGQMQWAADKLKISHLWRFMVSPMQAVNVKTGQRILFRGIDNPLKAKSINLGKGYIKIFWAEEVDQYGSIEELRSILQSIFRGKGEGKIAFFSFNPPKSARSWVNREVKIEKPGRIVHSSDYRTVPVEWLGERFLADAKHLEQVNPVAYRHEYLGEEVGTGLEVFNNVTVRKITDEERQSFGQINQGLDFGYAVDSLSFERMYYNAKKRTLWIFEEIAGIGISNRVLSEKMKPEHRNTETIADSAEPKSIDELRRDFGLRIKPAKKGPGSVESGIKWLADLEQIIIDPVSCPLASMEFVNYALEINRSGDVVSKYPDKNNHSIDSVRYGLENEMVLARASVPTRRPAGI
jgi:PBSX family phage terminase large subunit